MEHPAHGKTFFLDRDIEPYPRKDLASKIALRGGSVVAVVDANLDCLVLAEERRSAPGRSQPERQAAKFGSKITTLYENGLHQLLAPSREEALKLLNGGRARAETWYDLQPRDGTGVVIDLTGADLSGRDLTEFQLRNCILTALKVAGATLDETGFEDPRQIDFRNIGSHEGMRIWTPEDCNFDGLDLPKFYHYGALLRCSFRGTKMPESRLWSTGTRDCDFSKADLTASDLSDWESTNLVAEKAILHRANLRNAHLPGARLVGCVLTDANLEDAKLPGVDLQRADLQRANLTRANLTGADLSHADLREANLAEADLSHVKVTGADFTGANLRGTRLDGINVRSVKGLTESAAPTRTAGAYLRQLVADLGKARSWDLTFTLVQPPAAPVRYELRGGDKRAGLFLIQHTPAGRVFTHPRTPDAALLDLASTHLEAVPQIDTILLRPLSLGRPLQQLAIRALCEAFGQPVPEVTAVRKAKKAASDSRGAVRDVFLAGLRQGRDAIARWNALPEDERLALGDFKGVDLSRCDLPGIDLQGINATSANFEKADLRGAKFYGANFRKANLRGADLRKANLTGTRFHETNAEGADLREAELYTAGLLRANLKSANLRGASLMRARLQGADLTGADLANVRLLETEYDADTRFPEGYVPDKGWKYTGTGPRPTPAGPVAAPKKKQTLDFPAFFAKLPGVAQASRIKNALKMLKAEKFRLYSETSLDKVIGVVRSQSSKERVYACRLTSAGQFECGTQNLRPCGGLQGKVCKHLLVLILGLTRAATLDPGAALQWLQLAARQRPTFDKEVMTATFLRYKGVTTGEVDWRPTETVPEDYYAL
jgi:uncharacterized protein YjbI with pentapeptide repeats